MFPGRRFMSMGPWSRHNRITALAVVTTISAERASTLVAGKFPRIRVSGGPFERGHQYGSQAQGQVLAARAGYEQSFAQAGLRWSDAVVFSERYLEPVRDSFPWLMTEIEGIADGAGIPFEDIFAMNCRTEILWAAFTDRAGERARRYGSECSSFALTPARTSSGHTLVGQNWDWLLHGFESVVLLEVEREDHPNFVTIVEAGLLAKTTLNSAGLGIAVNTLVSSLDNGQKGVPFHVLIRALADCRTAFDAVETLSSHYRASSGNFVVGGPGGAILNIETAPGDAQTVRPLMASSGALLHTNHFLEEIVGGHDLAGNAMADSFIRLQRMRELVAGPQEPSTIDSLDLALKDHVDFPGSICCHPDPRVAEAERWSTVMSVVMDLEDRTLHLAEGNPCEARREPLDFRPFLTNVIEGAPRV